MSRAAIPLLLLLTLIPQAQTGPDGAGRMVHLNVMAVDSHGDSVNDLTEDDIRITDSGQTQRIALFQHKDNAPEPAPSPDEVSNRKSDDIPYATVILYDLLNEGFGHRGLAANGLVHALEPLTKADYLYVYLLTVDGRLYAVHGMPEDLQEKQAPGVPPWTRQARPLLDDALKIVSRSRPVDIDVAVRVPITYGALNSLARQMAPIPGRKNIVWITDGVPISLGPRRSDTGDFVDFTEPMRQLSQGLERAGISIYPVRQAMVGSATFDGGSESESMSDGAALDEFAAMTGGRPNGGRDIPSAIKQAVADVRSSYEIGYYPPSANWNDKLHKIRLSTIRKGVRLEGKTEYYAWKQPQASGLRQVIDAWTSSPGDARQIGLRARISKDLSQPGVARVELHINAGDVVLTRTDGAYTGRLNLSVIGYLSSDDTAEFPGAPLDLHYSSQEHDQALKNGILAMQSVPLRDDLEKVRVIVYDPMSQAVGSVTIRVR